MQARLLNTRMLKELDTINKSMNVAAKDLRSEINCFRHKFSKHETSVSSSGSEAADVRMFETHNPGFCFHRDGQYKKHSSSAQLSMQWFVMNIYPYIFTDGEIDPEKLICLHLLTVHTLEIPCPVKSSKIISHTINKSIPVYEKTDYESMLPLYLLESYFSAKRNKKKNLKEIQLINQNIMLLIGMIMNILNDINPTKHSTIMKIANSTEKLIKTLSHPTMKKILELLENAPTLIDLKNYALVNKSHFSILRATSSSGGMQIKSLPLPLNCFSAELFIGQIRFKLLKELKCRYRTNDVSEIVIKKINRIRKNTDNTLTNKSVEKPNVLELLDEACQIKSVSNERLARSQNKLVREKLSFTNHKSDDSFVSTLLRNMNNSQRLRVGSRVAQLKEKETILGNSTIKVSVPLVIQEVLSKKSIENLLASSFCGSSEERFALFENFSSLAELSLPNPTDNEENMKENHNLLQMYDQPSDHLFENKSSILFATIKQDIINKETEKRVTRFISKQFPS